MDKAFSERAGELKARVESVMSAFVDQRVQGESLLAEAVRYAVKTDGKRIRPLLSYATAELLDVPISTADYPAAAIELVHTYSLVHDDLPAMDDDDLRRGQPTVHKAFDEATAILVGDALLTHSFEFLASATVEPALVVQWVQQLARLSGATGMVQGQSTDLEGESRPLALAELETMHRNKSGGLINASLTMIARASGDEGAEKQLADFGHHIGLAFQIRDDILDVEASTEKLGKPKGSDANKNKSTFVSLMGIEVSKQRMQTELEAANTVLDIFGNKADPLRWIANFIVARDF
ncbi:MAG: polyprenyl synthetase family protein [Gammaproteobacteria bacterium]|nr:polyprenyl synthetase family protein [Gammaproteobacteria bacterium]MBT4492050.1 polyprenyl synthetase family protein [Gammaproteobacteria bacterium]MBT7370968.1 polyprenyl synthetase family protein [Gammaproteobacteria bacterium]